MRFSLATVSLSLFVIGLTTRFVSAGVTPGDTITKEHADQVADLVSPGNLLLVRQGMTMKIVPTGHLEWPPPYKIATEKYSSQVQITRAGALKNYVAGLPFPFLDENDPQLATKVMWNFSFRPLYTDDVDSRSVEIATYTPRGSAGDPLQHFTLGHVAFYNNVGRTEVNPIPTDPDAIRAGIRYRFAAYPILEPTSLRGLGFLRYRNIDPTVDDNTWQFNPSTRRMRRASSSTLSDAIGPVGGMVSVGASANPFAGGSGGSGAGSGPAATYASTLDPDSYFGFAAKIEDFNYKLLAVKPMLAVAHAETSPARPCADDGGRTICPENWEMRHLYVIEADAKKGSILGTGMTIPKRILYIDSEAWFITASDQYDQDGRLWKTIATFNAYRDRPVPNARIAIWPFKRSFQTALVDENVQDGVSTVVYSPGHEGEDRESWYINMGVISNASLHPQALESAGH